MTPLSDRLRSISGLLRFGRWLEETNWRFAQADAEGDLERHAAWVRESSRRLLEILHLQVTVEGPLPGGGLVVSNHLSYLDVLVLASQVPGVFICKREVSRWPLLGPLLHKAGTIFVDRAHQRDTARLVADLRSRKNDRPVLLFPEGTTSSGDSVLPFRSSAFAPWAGGNSPVQPAALGYRTSRGDSNDRVCFWREMTFVPHLFHLLGRRDVEARVVFGPPLEGQADRKQLAHELHGAVSSLQRERIWPWADRAAATAAGWPESPSYTCVTQ